MVSTTSSFAVSMTLTVSLLALATYRNLPVRLTVMPLGCRPTAMDFTCLHGLGPGVNADLLPPGLLQVVLRVGDKDAVAVHQQPDGAEAVRVPVPLAVGGNRLLHGGDGVERQVGVARQFERLLDLGRGDVDE